MKLKSGWKIVLTLCMAITITLSAPINQQSPTKPKEVSAGENVGVETTQQLLKEKKPKSLTLKIERPQPLHESFDSTLTDDEKENLIPAALKRRMGRFLFDFLDGNSGDGYAAPSYSMPDTKDIFGDLFKFNIDSNAVTTVGNLWPNSLAY